MIKQPAVPCNFAATNQSVRTSMPMRSQRRLDLIECHTPFDSKPSDSSSSVSNLGSHAHFQQDRRHPVLGCSSGSSGTPNSSLIDNDLFFPRFSRSALSRWYSLMVSGVSSDDRGVRGDASGLTGTSGLTADFPCKTVTNTAHKSKVHVSSLAFDGRNRLPDVRILNC
eukprot:SAG31_NODE_252_length_19068_cov_18.307713_13_plen_168_part_00